MRWLLVLIGCKEPKQCKLAALWPGFSDVVRTFPFGKAIESPPFFSPNSAFLSHPLYTKYILCIPTPITVLVVPLVIYRVRI
ncbi:uncharacterized protein BP01DRAFT_196965 [Aspergillus saccharolyticus JOP 1030-1]|uniref:Uncharacterized protein n=1 Tax=Aspergillus saccharolyticus JOP 1030-1 TaxID=1450539 RepID=A0A319AMH8_9EURO|nr:hypothetical protein BP01DRAFT_196965 [Aspergillus saccharolyticus JOP 1030-1]PYH47762.1 hypothetical protein BP01DRAFT_196965 [Aspergillus saccharolyticus JOP 1030-1]